MNTNDLTLETLQTEMWDLYKDAFGVRPRHLTAVAWADVEYLRGLWDVCIDRLKEVESNGIPW